MEIKNRKKLPSTFQPVPKSRRNPVESAHMLASRKNVTPGVTHADKQTIPWATDLRATYSAITFAIRWPI